MANHTHLVGIFSDRTMADRVLSELNRSGFGADEISVLAKDHEDEDLLKIHGASPIMDSSRSYAGHVNGAD